MLRGQHRDWFLALAERAEPEMVGPRQEIWLDRLDRERENLRAALGLCIERAEAEAGLRLVAALARFWQIRGPSTGRSKRFWPSCSGPLPPISPPSRSRRRG